MATLAIVERLLDLRDGARWMCTVDEYGFEDPSVTAESKAKAMLVATAASDTLKVLSSDDDAEGEVDLDETFTEHGAPPVRAPRLSDVGFVAALALRSRRLRLEAAADHDKWAVLIAIDGVRRELDRSIDALERALGTNTTEVGDGPSAATAQQIRRAYVRFADAVGIRSEPELAAVRPRLRLVGAAVVKLVGDERYREMRPADRRLIRGFHDRILAWLRTSSHDPITGLRLWRDVANMVELIMRINNRPELSHRDAALLRQCMAQIDAGQEREARQAAQALLGRDPDLDERLRDGASALSLRVVMRRALTTITRAGSGTGVSDSGYYNVVDLPEAK